MKNALLLFVLLALFSCKKKEKNIGEFAAPEPVQPGSYYPVYPGSWWKYMVNNSKVIKDSTSADYVLWSYSVGDPGYAVTYRSLVPLYNGRPVYRYSRLSVPAPYGSPSKYEFLTEKEGPCKLFANFAPCDFRYSYLPCMQEFIFNISKKVNANNDSVLIATGGFQSISSSTLVIPWPAKTYREYTKNVGLTFYCKVDTIKHDTLEKSCLIDYHIGAH